MRIVFGLLLMFSVGAGCASVNHCEDRGYGPIRGGPVYNKSSPRKRCAVGDPNKVKEEDIPEPTYWVRDCNDC